MKVAGLATVVSLFIPQDIKALLVKVQTTDKRATSENMKAGRFNPSLSTWTCAVWLSGKQLCFEVWQRHYQQELQIETAKIYDKM